MDEENKAIIIETSNEEKVETIIKETKGCLVTAIIIEDENEKRIFPH